MRNTLYAVVAASFAMLATSGIVAFATAAQERAPTVAEAELAAHLDEVIADQLDDVRLRLAANTSAPRRR